MLEILGYLASIVVIISILMDNMIMFRYINSISCCMFICYGMLRDDLPLIILNFVIILINIYHLTLKRN